MSKSKSASEQLFTWLRANLGKGALGCVTGTDARLLRAAAEIIDAYSISRERFLLEAFMTVVQPMTHGAKRLAYHIPAMVMEWEDRHRVWEEAHLPDIVVSRCEFEPGGSRREK